MAWPVAQTTRWMQRRSMSIAKERREKSLPPAPSNDPFTEAMRLPRSHSRPRRLPLRFVQRNPGRKVNAPPSSRSHHIGGSVLPCPEHSNQQERAIPHFAGDRKTIGRECGVSGHADRAVTNRRPQQCLRDSRETRMALRAKHARPLCWPSWMGPHQTQEQVPSRHGRVGCGRCFV